MSDSPPEVVAHDQMLKVIKGLSAKAVLVLVGERMYKREADGRWYLLAGIGCPPGPQQEE